VAPPPTTLIVPSGSAVIWLDVLVRGKAGLPGVPEHRIVSSTRPLPGEQSIRFTSLVGRVPLRARPPLTWLRPCAAAFGGRARAIATTTHNHRRGLLVVDGNQVVPRRFAIDCMRLDEATSGLGRRPGPFVQLPQLRSALDCRRCWKSGRGPRRLRGSTAAGQSNAAAVRRPPRQSRHAARRAGYLPALCAHEAGLRPGSASDSAFAVAGCWERSVTAATRQRYTSISRSRPRAPSPATGCRSSSDASGSWARSPARTSRTRSSACGPTGSCRSPQPVIRGHAATRRRLIAVSCVFLTRGVGRVDRAAGPNP
jgi:hypothetical protein